MYQILVYVDLATFVFTSKFKYKLKQDCSYQSEALNVPTAL